MACPILRPVYFDRAAPFDWRSLSWADQRPCDAEYWRRVEDPLKLLFIRIFWDLLGFTGMSCDFLGLIFTDIYLH